MEVGPGRGVADEAAHRLPTRHDLRYDLAVDASGQGTPSRVAPVCVADEPVAAVESDARCAAVSRCGSSPLGAASVLCRALDDAARAAHPSPAGAPRRSIAAFSLALGDGRRRRCAERPPVRIDVEYSHPPLASCPTRDRARRSARSRSCSRNDDPSTTNGSSATRASTSDTGPAPSRHHGERPTEQTIPALASRARPVTFDEPGSYQYICHLPGHEAYGMVGTLACIR